MPVDGQPWDTDPFTVTERGGRLYGRGTCDMKSFSACGLALVPEMVAARLKRPIHFALSYDEEVGCRGAPSMIAELVEHLPAPRAVIVGEPTDMRLVNAHKGMNGYETVVTGHEAHSSQTHRGVSAVMTAARLIHYLDEMARECARRPKPEAGFMPPYTTIHVGMVKGGTAANIISRECRFVWDLRNVPDDDPRTYLERFEAYCRDEVLPEMRRVAPEADIVTTEHFKSPGLRAEPGSAADELVRGAHRRQRHRGGLLRHRGRAVPGGGVLHHHLRAGLHRPGPSAERVHRALAGRPLPLDPFAGSSRSRRRTPD